MAYWWVNNKQTRDHEVRGDYWSNEGWLLPVAFSELEHRVRTNGAAAAEGA